LISNTVSATGALIFLRSLISSSVYYRVYKIQGATQSKQPADPSDLTVGYINVDSITPPHTAASVKRCIAKSEGLEDWKESQLCISISSESTVGEAKFVSLLTSDRPWSTPGDPMAFIEAPHARWNKRLKVVHGWSQLTFESRSCCAHLLFQTPDPKILIG
jgi:hypothetical protein